MDLPLSLKEGLSVIKWVPGRHGDAAGCSWGLRRRDSGSAAEAEARVQKSLILWPSPLRGQLGRAAVVF